MILPKKVSYILAMNLLAGMAGFAALLVVGLLDESSNWIYSFLFSFLYANCIGTIAFLLPHRFWHTGWIGRLAIMAALAVLGTLVAHLLLLVAGFVRPRTFWASYALNLRFSFFITMTVGVAIMTYSYARGHAAGLEARLQEKEKLAAEAKLASLASRIHPHFLFNTLNSISALIHDNPSAAEEQVQRLSSLLRFSLDAPEAGFVSLRQEIQIVRDYLAIEATRFGARLRYELDCEPAALEWKVPPLSIQTLVENSVKHAIAPRPEGGAVSVHAEVRMERLVIEVRDTGSGVPPGALDAGRGLSNLHGRLQTLYESGATLQFNGSTVRLELPA